jgi:hypothetical protein
MFKNSFVLISFAIVVTNLGCGSSSTTSNTVSTSNANAAVNSNTAGLREIKLDPANMPAGLSANTVRLSGNNMPPGISVNAVPPVSGKTPGIPSAEELKKGFKPGKVSTPGIPDQETIRKQMGMPITNTSVPPTNGGAPMMKSKRPLGGKP